MTGVLKGQENVDMKKSRGHTRAERGPHAAQGQGSRSEAEEETKPTL